FRAADGAEDHRVGGQRLGHVVLGNGGAMRVIRAAADQASIGAEIGELLAIGPGDQLFDLGHDLGADAVAGQKEKLVGAHEGSSTNSMRLPNGSSTVTCRPPPTSTPGKPQRASPAPASSKRRSIGMV